MLSKQCCAHCGSAPVEVIIHNFKLAQLWNGTDRELPRQVLILSPAEALCTQLKCTALSLVQLLQVSLRKTHSRRRLPTRCLSSACDLLDVGFAAGRVRATGQSSSQSHAARLASCLSTHSAASSAASTKCLPASTAQADTVPTYDYTAADSCACRSRWAWSPALSINLTVSLSPVKGLSTIYSENE